MTEIHKRICKNVIKLQLKLKLEHRRKSYHIHAALLILVSLGNVQYLLLKDLFIHCMKLSVYGPLLSSYTVSIQGRTKDFLSAGVNSAHPSNAVSRIQTGFLIGRFSFTPTRKAASKTF